MRETLKCRKQKCHLPSETWQSTFFGCRLFWNKYNSPIAVYIFVTFSIIVTIAIFMFFKLKKENAPMAIKCRKDMDKVVAMLCGGTIIRQYWHFQYLILFVV